MAVPVKHQTENSSAEELVPESHGPFGDYYVPRSKVTRSAELRAALAALESESHAS